MLREVSKGGVKLVVSCCWFRWLYFLVFECLCSIMKRLVYVAALVYVLWC
jgi:hypothetical protein